MKGVVESIEGVREAVTTLAVVIGDAGWCTPVGGWGGGGGVLAIEIDTLE